MKLVSRAARSGLTVVFFYVTFAMGCARHKDFTLKERNNYLELDVRMHPTLSHTITSVPCCTVCLALCGGMLRHYHGEVIFSVT